MNREDYLKKEQEILRKIKNEAERIGLKKFRYQTYDDGDIYNLRVYNSHEAYVIYAFVRKIGAWMHYPLRAFFMATIQVGAI